MTVVNRHLSSTSYLVGHHSLHCNRFSLVCMLHPPPGAVTCLRLSILNLSKNKFILPQYNKLRQHVQKIMHAYYKASHMIG